VYFEFHPSFCVVKSQASSEVLLHGVVGADGLYKFASPLVSFPALNKSKQCNSFSLLNSSISTSSLNNSKQCNSVSLPKTSLLTVPTIQNANVNISQISNNENSAFLYNLWHDRLGHPHHDALKEALKICNIHISSKPQNVFCSDCCLGKSHRLHAPASTTVYTLPLELIVCDLWGPAPITSSSGFTYFLTCVDAFSRFVWVYPLKKKSDTYNTFIQFQSMVELQFNCKIKSVQTDGGGEFRPLTQHLNKLGVTHRLTCPHTHHQNGLVERKHRHLVETGLTLLSKANLPMKYWDHAFITAAFLINRIPTPVLQNNSPYYVLLNKHPDYKALKIFGCACFPFLRPYHSTKLAYRSQECVFLGYSSTYKGYKCLSSDGRVYVSKDVLFNEQRFPYNQIFSKNKPVPTSPASTNSPSQLSLFLPSLSTNTPTPTQQTSSPPPTSPSASNTPTQPPVLKPIPLTTIPMSPDISTPTSLSDYSTTSSPPIQNSNAS
jgi:histone deacetylase 1/2